MDEKVKGRFKEHLDVCEYCTGDSYICPSGIIILLSLLSTQEKKIEELETILKRFQDEHCDSVNALGIHWGADDYLHVAIERLVKKIEELSRVEEIARKNIFFLQGKLDQAETRIKELEKAIEKHLVYCPMESELKKLIKKGR